MSFFAPNPRFHDISHEDTGHDEIDVTGLSGLLADGQTPAVHAADHQNGGGDEISVTGLSGLLGDHQGALDHKAEHQNGGGDELSVANLSGLLTDSQNPVAHAAGHQNGGGDEVSVTGLSGRLADPQREGSYVRAQEEQASGTAGGTFTAGVWQTRILNTKSDDPDNIAVLNANTVQLPAGTYRVRISAPAYYVNGHQLRLYNLTDTAVELLGTSERAGSESGGDVFGGHCRSMIAGIITLAAAKLLRVEHRCASTRATNGFGNDVGFGNNEVYTVAEFWKLP